MTLVADADLAARRWAVVILADGHFRRAVRADSLIQLHPQARGFALLAVDIPIGLPEGGADWPWPTDLEARALLGRRRATVLLTPLPRRGAPGRCRAAWPVWSRRWPPAATSRGAASPGTEGWPER